MIDTLHDVLKKELIKLFDGKMYKVPTEEVTDPPVITKKAVNIFTQYIPASSYESKDEEFPYILLRSVDGNSPIGSSETDPDTKVMIMIGIWDDDLNYQGYRDVLSIINKITTQFAQNLRVEGFEIKDSMKWAVNDDDYFPFFFGAIETNWSFRNVELQSNEYV